MTDLTQTARLETLLVSDASLASGLERFIKRGCRPEERKAALALIEFLDHRIEIARGEIRRIDSGEQPRYQVRELERFLPTCPDSQMPIRVPRKVTFFGLEAAASATV